MRIRKKDFEFRVAERTKQFLNAKNEGDLVSCAVAYGALQELVNVAVNDGSITREQANDLSVYFRDKFYKEFKQMVRQFDIIEAL